jgi:hypothetical protein
MNDPRHPVQPAPAGLPRTSPGLGPTQTIPRPAAAPQAPHAPHAPHPVAPAAPRPAHQQQTVPRPGGGGGAMTINPAAAPVKPADEEAIALVEDADEQDLSKPASHPSKITFGADLGVKKHNWKRQPNASAAAPVRVKTFHAKLSDQGLEYLDEAVNMFIDDHPEVNVKFVTTNIGMFDGKFKDLALIVNVWY